MRLFVAFAGACVFAASMASVAGAQECVSCWTDACKDLSSYFPKCGGKAAKAKKRAERGSAGVVEGSGARDDVP
jgi:hypothetical protein